MKKDKKVIEFEGKKEEVKPTFTSSMEETYFKINKNYNKEDRTETDFAKFYNTLAETDKANIRKAMIAAAIYAAIGSISNVHSEVVMADLNRLVGPFALNKTFYKTMIQVSKEIIEYEKELEIQKKLAILPTEEPEENSTIKRA